MHDFHRAISRHAVLRSSTHLADLAGVGSIAAHSRHSTPVDAELLAVPKDDVSGVPADKPQL